MPQKILDTGEALACALHDVLTTRAPTDHAIIESATLENDMRNSTGDDILRSLGLERRRTALSLVMPTVAAASAGILLGVGIGMLLAPKPGHQMRRDVGRRLSERRGLGTSGRREVGLGEFESRQEGRGISESMVPGSHVPA